MISENGCYPITDPLTGKTRGYISALLALGSYEQINALEQNITEGGYTIKTASKKLIPYQVSYNNVLNKSINFSVKLSTVCKSA